MRTRLLLLIAAGVLLPLLFVWYFDAPARNPPGFFIDESSIAYNAWWISRAGIDEHGLHLPLYFRAFGEYKNPVYVYLLAAVYRFTGPSIFAARTLSVVLGFAAACALAFVVRRITGRVEAAAFALLASLATPWLFETSRLVFEVAAFPLALAMVLLTVAELAGRERASTAILLACAVTLAVLTCTYTAGRLIGPALAAGLALLFPRRRLRELVIVWIAYTMLMIPVGMFVLRNPGALTARASTVGMVEGVRGFLAHYAASYSPRFLFLEGDVNARHHIPIGGMLLTSVALAALLGLIATIRTARRDGWSRYLLFALAIAPLPGSLTRDPPNALRLITAGVLIVVLAGIGVGLLLDLRVRLRYAIVAALFVALIAEGMAFRARFDDVGPLRISEFDATYPYVLVAALRTRQPIGVEDGLYYIHAWWYGALLGVDRAQLPRYVEGAEPRGTLMIGVAPPCATCRVLVDYRGFIAYVRE